MILIIHLNDKIPSRIRQKYELDVVFPDKAISTVISEMI
jgi:hypothetical protein